MNRKRLIVIVCALMIVSVFVSFYLKAGQAEEEKPVANLGVIDLSEWHVEEGETIRLDGEWEFVEGLVDSQYFATRDEPHYVKVPSLWTNYEINGQAVTKFTSGTYRLIVKLPENEQSFGIKTNNIRMSNAIFVNGEKIGQSGSPQEDKSYAPKNTPYVATFHSDENEIELLIHIANFNYATGGGIVSSIYFGNDESVYKLREKSVTYDWIMMATFFIVGLYFFGFYLHFRKDISLLYFSLFCFSIVLYYATHGEKLLHYYFPEMPYSLFQKLQGTSNLIGIFILAYFHHLFKDLTNKKVVKTLIAIGVLLSASMLLPTAINSQLQHVYSIYFLIINLYVLHIQIKAYMNKTTGSLYLLLGSFTLFIYFIVATLNVIGNTKIYVLPPVLPFLYLLTLSLFIAKRFTDTYRKNEELSEKLVQTDKFKDEFLAKTSHEFRTPLHGIIAILQSMTQKEDKAPLTLQQQEKINFVISKAKHLSSLVNDILDLAKVKRRELNVNIENVDVYANAHIVTEVFSYITHKDVQIENLIPRDIPFVLADEKRLRQILYNLVDNAIKYTDAGKIQIYATEENGTITISIKDTGIGIPANKIDTIFYDYEQIGHADSGIGVGLGLSITRELVQLQQGEISVVSKLGVGSTFSFTLPLAPQKTDGSEKNEERATAQHFYLKCPFLYGESNDKKVIIADDNHSNIKVLLETLKREGYFIIAVDNGNDVLKQLEEHPDVDLVLLDIMMPGMSGYEVCQKIRETYSLTELPVLMLTAAFLADDMVAAFQSGANDFLHKPIDIAELKTRMNNLIVMKETAEASLNMEVAYLQAQIKPHFIYNVLNSIMSLSYTDIEQTRDLIANFANFLRGSFVFMNTDKWIPIEKEVTLVQSYANIEKARYPEQFHFEIERDDNISALIPPLLIQPLVENAIRHGLSTKENGRVKLTIKENEANIIIQVIDNGVGMRKEKIEAIERLDYQANSGVGLMNIVKRLKAYPKASISIESKEQSGTTVTIVLPKKVVPKEGEGKW
ncbi:hybrid sensor histidine kinase/response regulator [Evansella cellulosilytica]|uniref:histidine kinase n=1 Tax=Evansella cellulosilytica (strain ATCC 21833 / DSM 2522 / FERM P-1141 / JCM 9156 / N-4) TaxID=649639 RepID=E6TWG5_EVAC2|nr:ATP-binding protein [Evansella cellulosilytica]ADU32228.1 integral membrane sensor hybrid histidine kinase [Evansella cellulosilytica DSM 2522]